MNVEGWGVERAQQLRGFAEDPGLGSRTHMVT